MKNLLQIMILLGFSCMAFAEIRVVTTLPVYAEIAENIGGDLVKVESIGLSNQDPHFVRPKPSYALKVRKADLFVTTGLDLELWVPALLDKAGNRDLLEGGSGYVSAADGMKLKEKPTSFSRSEGCIHVYGNPHVYTSPLNILVAAENIERGLSRVDPSHADDYGRNYSAYRKRILTRTFGDELLKAVPEEELIRIAGEGGLYSYLEEHDLLSRMDGWFKKALPLRGKEIITYHKGWIYFTDLFDVRVVEHVEAKVGIPPSLRHISVLTKLIKSKNVQAILAADYYDMEKVKRVASATDCQAIPVSTQPNKLYPTFENLMDSWIDNLLRAFKE